MMLLKWVNSLSSYDVLSTRQKTDLPYPPIESREEKKGQTH